MNYVVKYTVLVQNNSNVKLTDIYNCLVNHIGFCKYNVYVCDCVYKHTLFLRNLIWRFVWIVFMKKNFYLSLFL